MCVCLCVCECMYVSVYACVYVYIYIYICVYLSVCMRNAHCAYLINIVVMISSGKVTKPRESHSPKSNGCGAYGLQVC